VHHLTTLLPRRTEKTKISLLKKVKIDNFDENVKRAERILKKLSLCYMLFEDENAN